jgi:hypothetical protein
MIGKDLEAIVLTIPEHESVRVQTLRAARQTTGQLFPKIENRRLKRRMFNELEDDIKICEKICEQILKVPAIPFAEIEHPDLISVFL